MPNRYMKKYSISIAMNNENQNDTKIPSWPCKNGYHKKNAGTCEENKEPFYTDRGNVNCTTTMNFCTEFHQRTKYRPTYDCCTILGHISKGV
jgi:hypothetical protein